ncbi:MAG: cyclic nucleotide-binding domain-containing protein [Magnetococcales bacterium]|nr:cyclic nucleotide-binding domain-containing protein [Magnetococcales bacterium]
MVIIPSQVEEIWQIIREWERFSELDETIGIPLCDTMKRMRAKAGDILFRQGTPMDSSLFLISGRLARDEGHSTPGPGNLISQPGSMVGIPSLLPMQWPYDIRVDSYSEFILIEQEYLLNFIRDRYGRVGCALPFQQLVQQYERLQSAFLRNRIFQDMSQKMLHTISRACTLQIYQGGTTVFRKGDASDHLLMIVSGRLQAVNQEANGAIRVLSEIGHGDSVGEIGLILDKPRLLTVRAVRDTMVARLSRKQFEEILVRYPKEINRAFSHFIVDHLSTGNSDHQPNRSRRRVFSIFPAHAGTHHLDVANNLKKALGNSGKTLLLNRSVLSDHLGSVNITDYGKFTIGSETIQELNDLEFDYDYLIYVVDSEITEWTRLCLRQSDHVLIVARAEDGPGLGDNEHALRDEGAHTADSSLILLHPEGTQQPSGTAGWLSKRRVENHYPVRSDQHGEEDIARMVRFLTNQAVGLVLGGGGARGFAHIGVIQALQEAGIPIDVVGGNSMGAFLAGQLVLERSPEKILRDTIDLALGGENLTLPMVSFFAGRKMAGGVKKLFGDAWIEDLWRPFFSVSCNLSRARTQIHSRGDLGFAVLASNSPAGLLPPQVEHGDLLVDGAILNNLPIDVLRAYPGVGTVIAVDVNIKEDLFADSETAGGLSGWKVLWRKLLPFTEPVAIPSVMEILNRAGTIGGQATRAGIGKDLADLYLEPPVHAFSLTAYRQGEEIAARSFTYSREQIALWQRR